MKSPIARLSCGRLSLIFDNRTLDSQRSANKIILGVLHAWKNPKEEDDKKGNWMRGSRDEGAFVVHVMTYVVLLREGRVRVHRSHEFQQKVEPSMFLPLL